ncbi:hypothetical protein OAN61_00395 [bacterium]|nr:hypothetical protein [bacterium]
MERVAENFASADSKGVFNDGFCHSCCSVCLDNPGRFKDAFKQHNDAMTPEKEADWVHSARCGRKGAGIVADVSGVDLAYARRISVCEWESVLKRMPTTSAKKH